MILEGMTLFIGCEEERPKVKIVCMPVFRGEDGSAEISIVIYGVVVWAQQASCVQRYTMGCGDRIERPAAEHWERLRREWRVTSRL